MTTHSGVAEFDTGVVRLATNNRGVELGDTVAVRHFKIKFVAEGY